MCITAIHNTQTVSYIWDRVLGGVAGAGTKRGGAGNKGAIPQLLFLLNLHKHNDEDIQSSQIT